MPPLFPCNYESVAGERPDAVACTCSPRSYNAKSIALPYLHDAYRGNIIVTKSEPSFSYLVRSELLFQEDGSDHQRTSLRKHLFEMSKKALPFPTPIEFKIYCETILLPIIQDVPLEISYNFQLNDINEIFACYEWIMKFQKWFTEQTKRPVAKLNGNRTLGQMTEEMLAWVQASFPIVPTFPDDMRNYLETVVERVVKVIVKSHFSTLACRPYTEDDVKDGQIKKYLGFIDLRPKTKGFPVALGILAPPSRFDNNKNYVIITGDYSAPFGGVSNDCGSHLLSHFYDPNPIPTCHSRVQSPQKNHFSFYVAHDSQTIAHCSQSCMIMVAGLLSDRQGKVIGSLEASSIFAIESPSIPLKTFDRSPNEIRYTLEKYCNVNTICFGSENIHMQDEDNYIADRIIDACTTARCPTILFVGERALNNPTNNDSTLASRQFSDAHAVVVAGIKQPFCFDISQIYSQCDADEKKVDFLAKEASIESFILHDPARGPFVEIDAKKCFDACWRYDNAGNLNILIATPASITVSCSECLKELPNDMKKYLDPKLNGRFHIRLYSQEDIDNYILFPLDRQGICFSKPAFGNAEKYWVFFGVDQMNVDEMSSLPLPDIFIAEATAQKNTCPRCWYGKARYEYETEYATVLDLSFIDYSLTQKTRQVYRKQSLHSYPRAARLESTNDKVLLDGTTISPSVMTSSSGMKLAELFSVLFARKFDTIELFMLRNRDFIQWLASPGLAVTFPLKFPFTNQYPGTYSKDDVQEMLRQGNLSAADMFTSLDAGEESLTSDIVNWVHGLAVSQNIKISAFASYFSNIITGTHRQDLCDKNHQAILNCLDIAFKLKNGADGNTIIPGPIVFELVAGSSLRVMHGKLTTIEMDSRCIDNLATSLGRLIDDISALPSAQNNPWVLALEAEPGMTFAVNSNDALSRLLQIVDNNPLYRKRLGLNYDISHVNACGIDTAKFRDRFVNAHVSIFRGSEHYRDLPIVSRSTNTIGVATISTQEKQALLANIAVYQRSLAQGTWPKSKHISVELEGAPNFSFISESLFSLTGR